MAFPIREGSGKGEEDGNVTNDVNKNDEQHPCVTNPNKSLSKLRVVETTC